MIVKPKKENKMTKILHLDSSLKPEGSYSKQLSAALVAKLDGDVTYRDLNASQITPITGAHTGAFFTPAEDRSDEQNALLTESNAFLAELRDADIIVIGAAMYNYGIAASLKLYIDQIMRVGESFVYTETGPKGLLENKKLYVVAATGGTPLGSPGDHLKPQLETVFNHIGITDQTYISASAGMNVDPDATMATAFAEIDALAA